MNKALPARSPLHRLALLAPAGVPVADDGGGPWTAPAEADPLPRDEG